MKKDPGCAQILFLTPKGCLLFQGDRHRSDGDACDGTDGYYSDNHFLHKRFLLLLYWGQTVSVQ